jgi:hypothetical protein
MTNKARTRLNLVLGINIYVLARLRHMIPEGHVFLQLLAGRIIQASGHSASCSPRNIEPYNYQGHNSYEYGCFKHMFDAIGVSAHKPGAGSLRNPRDRGDGHWRGLRLE